MENLKNKLLKYAYILGQDGITKNQSLEILWYITVLLQNKEKHEKDELLANDIVDICNIVYK